MAKKRKRGVISKKAALFMRVYIAAVTLFSIWIILDQFVITHDYMAMQQDVFAAWTAAPTEVPDTPVPSPTPVPTASPISATATPVPTPTPTPTLSPEPTYCLNDTTYVNCGTKVVLSKESIEVEGGWTDVYTADVTLDSAASLKAAFANDTFSTRTDKTSVMAEQNGAILAINGDFCGARDYGYVVRNGVLYRSKADKGINIACIWPDGTMTVVHNQSSVDPHSLIDQGVWQVFSFGPILVEDGEINSKLSNYDGHFLSHNPRTAIGMIEPNHFLFVVSDGRSKYGIGMTASELAQYMLDKGATVAYNLDGGGSSAMYFNNGIVNHPSTNGSIKERNVSDIIYIAGGTE